MRQPQENLHAFNQYGQRGIRTNNSRRTFLIGGAIALIGGPVIFAGVVDWWITSRLLQPAIALVDKHPILNLSFTGNPPELEYAWSPDSTHIACATQSEIFLVNVKNGQVTGKQQLPSSSSILLIHWSTDGSHVLIAGKNATYVQYLISGEKQIIWPGSYQFFPADMSGNVISHLSSTALPTSIALSPDETLIAVATPETNDTVEIWNFQEGSRIAECQVSQGYTDNDEFDMAWAPDGSSLAVYIGSANTSTTTTLDLPTLTTWRASDGHLLWTSHIDNPGDNSSNRPGRIKWSPDGTTLAYTYTTSLEDYTTRLTVLDGQTGTIHFQTPLASFTQVDPEKDEIFAWSPDSARLALLSVEKGNVVIQIWDAKTGRYLFTCQHVSEQLGNIFWSPDGRYLAATVTNQPYVSGPMIPFWDAQTGKALFAYNAPESPQGLLWSPDSRFVAVNMITNSNCQPIVFGHETCSSITYSLQVFQVG